ncbi:aminotransferase class V-fold PLP-dependent enzyme [Nocardia sp. NBC_00881]|uniref:pyridoxal phosphate-dependent decarboxylase family protein n=1 Tax=Nocardia sp. NBC_00881 TaxID=2975995 RepID=UPI003865DC16|nr:aminotransferase class V-fold PLP-dependent enzyme [Nocardia sp. NBC_00881]
MTTLRELLRDTAGFAADFLDGLDTRPVPVNAGVAELRGRLWYELTDEPTEPSQVIGELVRDADPGLLGSSGGRFFGWVIGGSVPAALAADWLTSAWDQNAALYSCAPAEAVVEEVCGVWLKDLLGLPEQASFALVTGSQMGHVTALAAARNKLLAERDWDVERRGLAGAPALRIITGGQQHGSIDRAVRLLGVGTEAITTVAASADGRLDVNVLAGYLKAVDGPTIVCLQAGEINTGSFDDFDEACRIAHDYGAWVHVDGAYGLWAAASRRHRHLVAGIENADSWVTDAHKWLNVPFDCGLVFTAHPAHHRAALSITASYLIHAADPEADTPPRDQIDYNPEWSRRGRGFAVYAAIRSLGRSGIAKIIDDCCTHARRLTAAIGTLPGVEIVHEPQLNQGLVRFIDRDGADRTDRVVDRVQHNGTAWFGATTFNGQRAMRISVVSHRTTELDVDRTIEAVATALTEIDRS